VFYQLVQKTGPWEICHSDYHGVYANCRNAAIPGVDPVAHCFSCRQSHKTHQEPSSGPAQPFHSSGVSQALLGEIQFDIQAAVSAPVFYKE